MPKHAVNVFFTAERKNDQVFLAAVGDLLEPLRPNMVRKFDETRICAQFIVEAESIDPYAVTEEVAGRFEGMDIPGLKLAYVRGTGVTSVLYDGTHAPARVMADPEDTPKRTYTPAPVVTVDRPDDEPTLTVEEAMEQARKAVDEGLD